MTRSLHLAAWLVLGLVAAVLVLAEPMLRALLSRQLWVDFGLGTAPLRFLPLFLLSLVAGTLGLRLVLSIPDFASGALTLLLGAAQLNGLGLGPLDMFDFALGIVLLGWIARLALDPTRALRLSFLFFVAGGFLILAIAHLPMMIPIRWLVGLVGVIRILLIALLVVDLLRNEEAIRRTLRTCVLVAALSAIAGLVQFSLAFFWIYYFTFIDPPIAAFKPTPIGFIMRASGFCETAQHFSSFLLYALPAALWQFSIRWKPVDAVICLLLLAGIVVAFNFAAIFGAMLIIILFPLLRWPDSALHLVLAGLALLVAAYYAGLLGMVYDLTFGDSGVAKGVDQRKMLFQLGLEQIAHSPWVGTGLNGFGGVDGNFWDRPVHNIFGQAGAELGILGLLLILTVFLILPLELALAMRGGDGMRSLLAIALMMVIGGLFASQAEPNLQQSNLWLVFAIAQAAIIVGTEGIKRPPPPAPSVPVP